VIEGVGEALAQLPGDFQLLLAGDQARVEEELARVGRKGDPRVRVVHASEVVEMHDPPATAIRAKKDSSINVAVDLVKRGEAGVILEVRADGFRPFRQFVVPSEDQTFTLERAPERTTGPVRPPGPSGADARATTPGADASVAVTPPPPPPPPADAGGDGTRIRTGFPGPSTSRDAGGASAPADAGGETRIRTSFP